jgi:hypothetical protein
MADNLKPSKPQIRQLVGLEEVGIGLVMLKTGKDTVSFVRFAISRAGDFVTVGGQKLAEYLDETKAESLTAITAEEEAFAASQLPSNRSCGSMNYRQHIHDFHHAMPYGTMTCVCGATHP